MPTDKYAVNPEAMLSLSRGQLIKQRKTVTPAKWGNSKYKRFRNNKEAGLQERAHRASSRRRLGRE